MMKDLEMYELFVADMMDAYYEADDEVAEQAMMKEVCERYDVDFAEVDFEQLHADYLAWDC